MKIPRSNAGGTKLTTQTGVARRDPGQMTQVSRAVSGLGEVVQKQAQRFEDLYWENKKNEVALATYEGVTTLEAEAKTDINIDDPAVQKKYNDRMSALKEKVMGDLPDGMVKSGISNAFDLEALKFGVGVKAYGRTALMHKTIANKQELFRKTQKEYITADPTARPEIFGIMSKEVDKLVSSGFILPEKADELKDKARQEWNTQAALKDTEVYGADYVLSHLSDYDVDDKEKLVQEVKRVALIQTKQFDLNQAIIQQAGQKEVFDVIGNAEIGYIDKLDAIQKAKDSGKIDDNTAKIAEQNLNSANKIDAKTRTSDMADIVRLVGDLNVGVAAIDDKDNAETLLKRIKEAKNLVIGLNTKGKLTTDDKDKLLIEIESKTIQEQRKAAEELRSSGSPFHWGYNDADKYFKDNLVSDVYRNEAIREFFYAISGRKVNGTQRKEIADTIMLQIKNKALGVEAEGLSVGAVVDGYKFKGGDRYNKDNWEKI